MPTKRSLPRVGEDTIRDGINGICLECHAIQYGGVEPDAREYICDHCGEPRVFGLDEALIMGEIEVTFGEGCTDDVVEMQDDE